LKLNFDILSKQFTGNIPNIRWKYEQPSWLNDIIFTILFEVDNRLFYIRANKSNLIEILTKTHIVGPLQDFKVDVSGCFLKNMQPLLWKDFFCTYFNNESAETVVRGCISLNMYYSVVNLISWNYYESPFNDWDRDNIFDNIQTLSIKYYLDDKAFTYKVEKFDLETVLGRSNLVQSTLYPNLRALTEGVYNNKGKWVNWQTFFNNEFSEVSAVSVLKEYLSRGRYN
jgi:hypothetical protein